MPRHEHETTGLRTNLHPFVNVRCISWDDHLNDLVTGEDGWLHSSCLVLMTMTMFVWSNYFGHGNPWPLPPWWLVHKIAEYRTMLWFCVCVYVASWVRCASLKLDAEGSHIFRVLYLRVIGNTSVVRRIRARPQSTCTRPLPQPWIGLCQFIFYVHVGMKCE